jgi:DNA-binding SARP family transcriptional activator
VIPGSEKPGDSGAPLPALLADYKHAREALEQLARRFLLSERELASAPPRPPQPEARKPFHEVSFRLLGPFEVCVDGRAVELDCGLPGQRVLKLLAARGPVPTQRDVILEALWPGATTDVASNRLRVAVSSVRKCLGDTGHRIVQFRNGSYQVCGGEPFESDAARFDETAALARRCEHSGEIDRARELYAACAALYRGDFLEADRYEDWAALRREQIKDNYLNVLLRLAALSQAAGDNASCIDYCRRLLECDPCSEEAYRLLMRSHDALGQHGRVAAWFDICRATLRRELDVRPSHATVALRDALLGRRAG